MNSLDLLVMCFCQSCSYSSRGCPLTYIPRMSFSNSSRVSLSNSGSSGKLTPSPAVLSSSTRSNNDICPAMPLFFSPMILSTIIPYTPICCFLFPPRQSHAPHFMKFSMERLLRTSIFLFIKSSRSLNLPFSLRSSTIASITALPTLLIAESAYLIESPDTENAPSPSFTSGGSSLIPILLHTSMYSETFDALSITDVMRAAMNSSG